MKKLVLLTCLVILGQACFYLVFAAFYDSWLPYYYGEYTAYLFPFLSGAILFTPLVIPFVISFSSGRLKPKKKSPRIGYYYSYVWFNLLVITVCFAVFVYMLTNGFWLEESGFYKIVPISNNV